MRGIIGVCFLVFLSNCGNQLCAQDQAPNDFLAQKLVDELLAKHQPELLYVGLHLVPPSGTDMAIVAATRRDKIGHKSSCADLHVLSTDVPILEMKGGGGSKINGTVIGSTILAPLHDRRGNTIGMINMGLKFTTGEESEAAKFGRSIQREIEGEIPSKMALFPRAR
jgi:hypothetical protein